MTSVPMNCKAMSSKLQRRTSSIQWFSSIYSNALCLVLETTDLFEYGLQGCASADIGWDCSSGSQVWCDTEVRGGAAGGVDCGDVWQPGHHDCQRWHRQGGRLPGHHRRGLGRSHGRQSEGCFHRESFSTRDVLIPGLHSQYFSKFPDATRQVEWAAASLFQWMYTYRSATIECPRSEIK